MNHRARMLADAAGTGTLVEPRLYQLMRQSGEIVDRTVAVEIEAAGAEGYVFTFG